MRLAGILITLLGLFHMVAYYLASVNENYARGDNLNFVNNSWSPIMAIWFFFGGLAFLYTYRLNDTSRQDKSGLNNANV